MTATLVITRPAAQADRFAALCRGLIGPDLPVLIAPVVDIKAEPLSVELAQFDWLIVTSQAAIQSLTWPENLPRLPIWAVGPRTAEAARAAGFVAHDGGGDAAALIATIIAARPSGRLLHLHGAETRGRVAEHLRAAGLSVTACVAYRQNDVSLAPKALRVLHGVGPIILPIFSARSAQRLLAYYPTAPCRVVAISEAVAGVWPDTYGEITITGAPTAISMAQSIAALYDGG